MEPDHVLVAIADWELRGACRETLRAAGYRVTTAATEDAAKYMLDAPDPPEALVVCASEPLAAAVRALLERGAPRPGVALVDGASSGPPDGTAALAAVERALRVDERPT